MHGCTRLLPFAFIFAVQVVQHLFGMLVAFHKVAETINNGAVKANDESFASARFPVVTEVLFLDPEKVQHLIIRVAQQAKW